MKKVIFLLLLVQSGNVLANSSGDTLTSHNQSLSRLLKLPDIRLADRELRIFRDRGFTNGGEVLVIRTIGLKWEGFLYRYVYKMKNQAIQNALQKVEMSRLVPKNGWTHLWNGLTEQQLLTLPDDHLIEHKKKGPPEYNAIRKDTMYRKVYIIDGTSYDVELKAYGLVRYYAYNNPESYLDHFPEVEELQHFAAILRHLREEFSIAF